MNMSGVIILNCIICGAKVQGDEEKCSDCKEVENKVQVLSVEERQDFDGITLEQDQKEQGYYDYEKSSANQKIYSKQFSIGHATLLTKIVIGIILIFMVVVALPVALFLISVVSLFLYLVRK